jgi:hypothetical protein
MDHMDATLYGATNEQADWQEQSPNLNSCAEMSAADVIQQATPDHVQLSETEITNAASQTMITDPTTGQTAPMYDPAAGTDIHGVPSLLAQYGVSSHFSEASTGQSSDQRLADLEQALAAGQHVIASVDAQEIWNAIPGVGVSDDPGKHDHELVVTGVDSLTGQVSLNDSGVPTGAEEHVDINTFMDAWSKSNFAMVSTDSPAPMSDPLSIPSAGPTGETIQAEVQHLQNVEHQLNEPVALPVVPLAFGGAAAAAALVVREVISERNRAAAGTEPGSGSVDQA